MSNIKLNKSLEKEEPEIFVNFTNESNPELKIDLFFNETLSKMRKKQENFSSPYSENIMILFIDSVSRVNSLRQLKRTLKFFESFMKYEGKPSYKLDENFHSFQFFKYHSFLGYTGGNYPLMIFGNITNQKSITKYLKENGYITSFISDMCIKDAIFFHHKYTEEELYDHQFVNCDPNRGNPYITKLN